MTREKLAKANSDNVAGLRAAGYEVDNCFIETGDAGAWYRAMVWDRQHQVLIPSPPPPPR
jgi:hypothetical protein